LHARGPASDGKQADGIRARLRISKSLREKSFQAETLNVGHIGKVGVSSVQETDCACYLCAGNNDNSSSSLIDIELTLRLLF